MSTRRTRLLELLLAALVLWGPSAASEELPWFRERVSLDAAAVLAFVDTDVEVSGRTIDLESDLGLDDFAVVPSANLLWRFAGSRRHRLEASYFSLLRSDDIRSGVELTLPNDVAIPIDARVDTEVGVHVASLTYGYDFLRDPRVELGLILGLDFIVLDAEVEGTLSAGDRVVSDQLAAERFDVPFPTAGLFFNWAIFDRLALGSRFQYFGLKIDDVEGELFRGTVRLEHRTFDHLHLYAGYELLGANVDLNAKSFQDLSLFYHGPRLGVVLRF